MGQFKGALALHAQPHEETARLRRSHLAVHEGCKTRRRHFGGEVFPAGQTLQNTGEVGGFRACAEDALREVAQQAQAVRRKHGLGVELHPHPRAVIVAQGHNFAFGCAGSDRKPGVFRVFIGAYHKGVVAAHAHGVGQAQKHARAVVHDFRLFAVHDARADLNLGPGMQPQKLMPKAHAQHGNARAEAFEELRAKPRIGGMPRPWRNADHGKLGIHRHVQHGGVIVAQHHGLVAQGVKSLHKIVGKGIVIIDEQKHILRPPHAGPGA